jgi:hypothetical protein
MKKKVPCRTSPCKNCPFKKDTVRGWLGEEKMTEILQADSFVCHKNHGLQCAGFMLIQGDDSAFVQVAKRYKIDLKLRGREKVFDTKQDCILHHSNNETK